MISYRQRGCPLVWGGTWSFYDCPRLPVPPKPFVCGRQIRSEIDYLALSPHHFLPSFLSVGHFYYAIFEQLGGIGVFGKLENSSRDGGVYRPSSVIALSCFLW